MYSSPYMIYVGVSEQALVRTDNCKADMVG